MERYKTKLVAKGYTKAQFIDYQEIFGPMVKMNDVRALLSLPADFNWYLEHFNVKNVFFHDNLEEEM